VAFEPYSSFMFPKGELPQPIQSTGLFGELKGVEIPLADFEKLTKIPIVIYYGDNIAKQLTKVWNMDHWSSGLEIARIWAATINKYEVTPLSSIFPRSVFMEIHTSLFLT
ncbi:MAG: hypothetical protein ACN6PN_26365, partial [Sphingobacterium sp.]